MNDISDWLEALGMPEYLEQFIENDVDVLVLAHLTDQDLKELGVTLGHRRKMLSAIQRREPSTSARTSPTLSPSAAPAVSPTIRAAAERRQLTVMFCDLVGSTALSRRVDPEDMREIIGAYHRCCTSLVQRHGGFVAKYMGDGVLAYFGYPIAHEHDAERSVQAGLAMVAAAPKLVTAVETPLQVRVGIATGIVVVGDLLGSGEAQERGITGDTPNLAARLQGIAQPGSVVIADGTRRLLGNLFELKDLGDKDLKGIAGPTRAWAAISENTQTSRFEALHASGLSPLVGREDECELMLRRWAKAKTGDGQIILLSGEAGIGKSRLTAAFLEELTTEPYTRLRYFCSPQHEDSAFFPIIGQLERAAGFAHEDDAQSKLEKLDVVLAATATSREDAALIADLLSLPDDDRHPTLMSAPAQRRQKTMEALGTQIDTLMRTHPVLMIFEDAHWADPSSLELLGRLVDRIERVRVLMLVTSRPEFIAPWIGRPNVTAMTISRLTQTEVIALIGRVVGNKAMAAHIRQDIVERADGVPLFVEEMTKAVLETQSEGTEQTLVAIPSLASAVPATLHASLMARLDRLGEAKAVAQMGAAIGREFSHDLIAAVFGGTDAELDLALTRLIHAGLLFQQGVAPHITYLFKHALVQDAAYGTLLREQRRGLHARIGEALESTYPDIADSRPEILARHCGEAGSIELAAGLWGKAGQKSLERSALVEAIEQLSRALGQLEVAPDTAAVRRDRIKLQVALISSLMHVNGHAAPETKAAAERARLLIERAEALGEPPEDPLLLFSVLYGFWVANYVSFNGHAMLELAAQLLALAETQRATLPLMIGHRLMGSSQMFTGSIANSRTHYNEAIALYDPAAHRPLITRFSQDVRVATLFNRSWALWILGYPDAALADSEQALRDAREIGHAPTLIYALGHAPWTLIHRGEFAATKSVAEELVMMAGEKGTLFWQALGKLNVGWCSAATGQTSEAVSMISSGLAAWGSTGATGWTPLYLAYLASAFADRGNFEEARRCIDDSMTIVDTTNERWCEADIHRITGEIALCAPQPDTVAATACFERALTIARRQQSKAWELRAATSLARLYRDLGQRFEAIDLLAPVFGWFTEGFGTRDLREAKSLLDDLETREVR